MIKLKTTARLTDKIYKNFIDNGVVPKGIIKLIAIKCIKNEKLSEQELAIFYSATAEINETIIMLDQHVNFK